MRHLERALYTAQQDSIVLRLAEQVNRVTLYKVLGGGYGGPDEGPVAADSAVVEPRSSL